MRVTKWIDVSQEVEIEIGTDEIQNAIKGWFDSGADHNVKSALNDIAKFMKCISDEQIEKMGPASKAIVGKFLAEQSARFTSINPVKVRSGDPSNPNET